MGKSSPFWLESSQVKSSSHLTWLDLEIFSRKTTWLEESEKMTWLDLIFYICASHKSSPKMYIHTGVLCTSFFVSNTLCNIHHGNIMYYTMQLNGNLVKMNKIWNSLILKLFFLILCHKMTWLETFSDTTWLDLTWVKKSLTCPFLVGTSHDWVPVRSGTGACLISINFNTSDNSNISNCSIDSDSSNNSNNSNTFNSSTDSNNSNSSDNSINSNIFNIFFSSYNSNNFNDSSSSDGSEDSNDSYSSDNSDDISCNSH